MRRELATLAKKEYDVVVLGGGIFGVCVAWDAVLRGLSVALVERSDFCGATSANSFRMIHGGIRYLQHGDLYRIRESCRERRALLRIAPHLAHPLPIVIPTYRRGLERKSLLRAAFSAYDLATFDRNKGIADSDRRIPPGRMISREECLSLFPGLQSDDLTGAGIFHDGQLYNPPRLALAFLKSALDRGCDAANYVEASGFLTRRGRVTGIVARDRLNDETFEIRGRLVVNAAGPWADRLTREKLGIGLTPGPTFSRDACLVVRHQLLGGHALAVQGGTKDPDALVSRGKRHLFIVPWRRHSLIGVWHIVYKGAPDRFTVTEVEIKAFIDEMNDAYPPLQLQRDDITMWNAGLVLFGENEKGEADLSYGKRSRVIDHARADNLGGLITLIGVRWTTARGVAEKVIDLVFKKMGKRSPKCRTESTPLYGGRIESFDSLSKQAVGHRPPAVSTEVMEALIRNHGAEYSRILAYVDQEPRLGETLNGSLVLKAEIVNAVRDEMAQTLSDVAFRRTDLATAGHPGDTALRECAGIVAGELGWSESRKTRELDEVVATFPDRSVRA
jgi:glycerol-3-phosphate dehydrogenase